MKTWCRRYACLPMPKEGVTNKHAQLGLPDRGRVIKELVVCGCIGE